VKIPNIAYFEKHRLFDNIQDIVGNIAPAFHIYQKLAQHYTGVENLINSLLLRAFLIQMVYPLSRAIALDVVRGL
jgi:hypothetical protein